MPTKTARSARAVVFSREGPLTFRDRKPVGSRALPLIKLVADNCGMLSPIPRWIRVREWALALDENGSGEQTTETSVVTGHPDLIGGKLTTPAHLGRFGA